MKKHTIKTLDDLCNLVNDDNVELLAQDLVGWLIAYNKVMSFIRQENPEKTKDLKNTDMAKGYFVWVDDGKTGNLGYEIED